MNQLHGICAVKRTQHQLVKHRKLESKMAMAKSNVLNV